LNSSSSSSSSSSSFFLLLPLKTPCPSVLGQFKKQGRKENKERKEGKKKG
jgi:hypothetical protein